MRTGFRRLGVVSLVGLATAALALLEVRAQTGGAKSAARFKGDPGNTKYEAASALPPVAKRELGLGEHTIGREFRGDRHRDAVVAWAPGRL